MQRLFEGGAYSGAALIRVKTVCCHFIVIIACRKCFQNLKVAFFAPIGTHSSATCTSFLLMVTFDSFGSTFIFQLRLSSSCSGDELKVNQIKNAFMEQHSQKT